MARSYFPLYIQPVTTKRPSCKLQVKRKFYIKSCISLVTGPWSVTFTFPNSKCSLSNSPLLKEDQLEATYGFCNSDRCKAVLFYEKLRFQFYSSALKFGHGLDVFFPKLKVKIFATKVLITISEIGLDNLSNALFLLNGFQG